MRGHIAAVYGWCAAILAAAGVLLAWADPVSGLALNAACLVLTAGWLVHAVFRKETPRVHWLAWVLLGCAGWGVLQMAANIAVYRDAALHTTLEWLARAGVFAVTWDAFRHAPARARVLDAGMWFAGVLSAVAIVQWFSFDGRVFWLISTDYSTDAMGPFANRDQWCSFAALWIPVAVCRALRDGNATAAVFAASMVASVVASGSRAGIAIVIAELLVLAVMLLRTRRSLRPALAVVVLAVVCTAVVGHEFALERFQMADPLAYRREMWTASLAMISDRPLTGFGLGSWPSVYPAFAVFDPGVAMNHAHSDWLEWAADGGAPLALLTAILACATLAVSRRVPWAIGAPAVLLHATVDFPMQKAAVAIAFCFMLALACAERNEANARSSNLS